MSDYSLLRYILAFSPIRPLVIFGLSQLLSSSMPGAKLCMFYVCNKIQSMAFSHKLFSPLLKSRRINVKLEHEIMRLVTISLLFLNIFQVLVVINQCFKESLDCVGEVFVIMKNDLFSANTMVNFIQKSANSINPLSLVLFFATLTSFTSHMPQGRKLRGDN